MSGIYQGNKQALFLVLQHCPLPLWESSYYLGGDVLIHWGRILGVILSICNPSFFVVRQSPFSTMLICCIIVYLWQDRLSLHTPKISASICQVFHSIQQKYDFRKVTMMKEFIKFAYGRWSSVNINPNENHIHVTKLVFKLDYSMFSKTSKKKFF